MVPSPLPGGSRGLGTPPQWVPDSVGLGGPRALGRPSLSPPPRWTQMFAPPPPPPFYRGGPWRPGRWCGWTQSSGCWLPINQWRHHKGTPLDPPVSIPRYSHGGSGAAPLPRPPAAACGTHLCQHVSHWDPPPPPPPMGHPPQPQDPLWDPITHWTPLLATLPPLGSTLGSPMHPWGIPQTIGPPLLGHPPTPPMGYLHPEIPSPMGSPPIGPPWLGPQWLRPLPNQDPLPQMEHPW